MDALPRPRTSDARRFVKGQIIAVNGGDAK